MLCPTTSGGTISKGPKPSAINAQRESRGVRGRGPAKDGDLRMKKKRKDWGKKKKTSPRLTRLPISPSCGPEKKMGHKEWDQRIKKRVKEPGTSKKTSSRLEEQQTSRGEKE